MMRSSTPARRATAAIIGALLAGTFLSTTGCDVEILGPGVEIPADSISASGTVLDTEGNPVSGVIVFMFVEGHFTLPWTSSSVVTDAQGRFEIKNHELAQSLCRRVELVLRTDSHLQTIDLGSCRDHTRQVLWNTESGEVSWTLNGTVVEGSGAGLVGATVRFEDWDGVGSSLMDADSTSALTCNQCTDTSIDGIYGSPRGYWWLSFTPPSTARCYRILVTAIHLDGRTLTDTVNACGLTTEHTFNF